MFFSRLTNRRLEITFWLFTDLQTDAPVINDLPRQQSFEIATNVKMSKDDIILARVSYQGLDRNTSFAAVSQQEKELQDLKDEGVLELSFDDDGGLNLASAEASKLSRYNYEMLRMLLRFFQLIAEGHNISLQLYMQYQSENAKSYDIVKSVVDYIHAIVPLTSAKNIPVIVQAFDTLIDFAQGCTRNQVNIFQSKIIQPINRILEETYPHIPSELVISLKGKAVLCLLSLLEDDSESDTKQIFEDMSQTLNVPDLTRNM